MSPPSLFAFIFFPASESFPMNQFFTSSGKSNGASASGLPMSNEGWFPLGLIGLISLQSKGLSSLLRHHNLKVSVLLCSVSFVFGEGNGIPLQYSCLENPMDGGAWQAAVHGVSESWTRLSDFTFTFSGPYPPPVLWVQRVKMLWDLPNCVAEESVL